MTRAITEAEKIANETLIIDQDLIKTWVHDANPVDTETVIGSVRPEEVEVVVVSDTDTLSTAGSSHYEDISDDDDTTSEISLPSTSTSTGESVDIEAVNVGGDIVDAVSAPVGANASGVGVDDVVIRNDDDGEQAPAVLDDSIPWEEYHLDPPPAEEVVAEAVAAGLRIIERNQITFLTNMETREQTYRNTGKFCQFLVDQKVMG